MSEQRNAALDLAARVGMRTSAVDVLAGFLGFAAASEVSDLANLLNERVTDQRVACDEQRTGPEIETSHAVLAAFQLGWDRLPGEAGREAVRSLALLASRPVPRVILAGIPGVGAAGIEDALWGGFASLDDAEDRLVLSPSLREFVGSCPEPREEFVRRPQRIFSAIREQLAVCDLEDERYDEAAQIGFDFALRLAEYGFAGSIARRMGDRLRRRGSHEEAVQWNSRLFALLEAGHEEVTELRGLALMDRGLLELGSSRLPLARDSFFESVSVLEDQLESRTGAGVAILAQARLLHAQVLLELGERAEATEALGKAEVELVAWRGELEQSAADVEATHLQLRLESLELALCHALRLRGILRMAVGQHGAALVELREAEDRWRALQGTDHGDGAAFQLSLAQVLRASGRDSEIDEPLELARVLAGGEMDRIPQPSLPVVLHDLGVAAADRGEFEHAETLLVESAMLAAGLVPDDDPLHAQILYTRGLTLLARGQVEQAESIFVDAERRAAQGRSDPRFPQLYIQAARAWASARDGRDRYGEVVKVLRETEDQALRLRGPENTFSAHLRALRRSLEG